jgi:NAD+ kinase
MIEERMMLSGYSVTAKDGEHLKKRALNDIVICRKGPMQLLELQVFVNGEFLNIFRADGIIVATPTGSTGYSMSAGGPILDPKARMILITPMNPHELNARSIVIGAEDEVTIEVRSRQSPKEEMAQVHFDGEPVMELAVGDAITIHASGRRTKILKLSRLSFLETLRKKMQIYRN